MIPDDTGSFIRGAWVPVEAPDGVLTRAAPAALDAVVLRCLASAPADRFPDMAALDAALAALALTWTHDDAATCRRRGFSRKTFSGLRSECTTPMAWPRPRASQR